MDTDLLAMGKVALVEAEGLLPDGTPFDLPADAPLPSALELDETVKEQVVYLALPLRQLGLVEARDADATDATLRYRSRAEEVSPRLAGFIGELVGLLHLTKHLDAIAGLHPELLYRLLLPMAGELSTFTVREKRPPEFPTYRHDDLAGTFMPVMAALRDALSKILKERAIPIPIQERKYGFRVAPVSDRTLLTDAGFILAAHAKINPETLRNRFPAQVKIGPVEKIQELVKLALPGIALQPLPVAPRQIPFPFHAGFVYFELDRNNELWEQLKHSSGFSLHIGGEFPNLELEFWAIRE